MQVFSPELLQNLGIVDWGGTHRERPESFDHFSNWVDKGLHNPLHYLGDHRKELRSNLKNVFPEYQTALVFLFSYAKTTKEFSDFYESDESNGLRMASYVLGFEGLDYHIVLLEKLERLKKELLKSYPQAKIIHSLDIQPILERDLAYSSGLGWFGKNSMLINQKHGSYFIIGSLLIDQKIDYPEKQIEIDHCGSCTKCIDFCPTDAIDPEARTLISEKCISTYTIEVFKPERMDPPSKMEESRGEIYGCDICQDVCPWNQKVFKSMEMESHFLSEKLSENTKLLFEFFLSRPKEEVIAELKSMSNKAFEKKFKQTPLARTRRVGVLKNLEFWQNLES
ncbi:MAG: epoxyqueuosine reductase [Bacteriovoracaceae bacterium]